MPDLLGRDMMPARIWRRSGQLALAALIGIAGSAAFGQTKPTDTKAVRAVVDAAAARYIQENPQAAAIAIGVVYGPSRVQSRAGTLEPSKARPPRADTLYPLASITKTFTGTLLAQAVIEKRLSLSDDIRKYLSGEYPNLEFGGRPILVSDLLDHRSGLPFLLPDRPELAPDYKGDARPYTVRVNAAMQGYGRAQFFSDVHAVKLTAMPGSHYQYSNAGAQLAGYILEKFMAGRTSNCCVRKS